MPSIFYLGMSFPKVWKCIFKITQELCRCHSSESKKQADSSETCRQAKVILMSVLTCGRKLALPANVVSIPCSTTRFIRFVDPQETAELTGKD